MSKMTSLLHKSRHDSSSFLRFYGVENQGAENSLRIFFAKPDVIRRYKRGKMGNDEIVVKQRLPGSLTLPGISEFMLSGV
ncbi:hypothetical protein [Phytobacter sp. RSE-02]|uniref:hypothetical protein n=1 Tax=Phytobacter sp. RSE-02 TaxID=3229229 RepID=UPI00339D48C6